MSLTSCLENFFELPGDKAYHEGQTKLQGTVMHVNGLRVRIDAIGKDRLSIYHQKLNKLEHLHPAKINTLTAFLPESGVYLTDKNIPIILFRKPIRQWHKSYHDEIYQIVCPVEPASVLDIVEETHQEIWMDKNKIIWHWTQPIGKFEKDILFCTNLNYKQELIDWSGYGRVETVRDIQV